MLTDKNMINITTYEQDSLNSNYAFSKILLIPLDDEVKGC